MNKDKCQLEKNDEQMNAKIIKINRSNIFLSFEKF